MNKQWYVINNYSWIKYKSVTIYESNYWSLPSGHDSLTVGWLVIIIIILILGFVRAAGGQGLNLAVIIHESRALTEGKQIRETFFKSSVKNFKKIFK